jgi:cytidylate kinase
MSIPITEKLIQRQINHWNGMRRFLKPSSPSAEPPPPPTITVSRLAGSGGRSLACALRDRLGLKLHDRSLVEQVMRQENLPPALAAELDEQVASQSSLWIKGLFNRRIFLLKEYQHALSKTINTLAAAEGGVFLGRGANHVLGDRATLRVRLVASFDQRLLRIQGRCEMSRAEARALLHETDRARADFVQRVFGIEPGQARNFDLTVNTDRINAEDVVELVLLGLLARVDKNAVQPLLVSRGTG